ncbi:L,D-transpeptidase [Streptomyces sp. H27-D2]|uniref:L,D-transpeptidase n=1 Tax=Streptomyces sp. H27-D2 TaxID=3046304 RepID=UPI002DBCD242|nr:Ig-like domain-containing protein [Streptomyces sp. H27-D2]MEC4016307.1 Ig-like domain-containing protein [Streptomyces sp. H27-D2]
MGCRGHAAHTERIGARRAVLTAVLAMMATAGALAGLAGCGAADGGSEDGQGRPRQAITITPRDGTENVRSGGRIEVRVPDGRLQRVQATRTEDALTSPVPGRIASDGLSWQPTEDRLALAGKYSVDAVAVDAGGHRSARHSSFTTYVPRHRFIGFFTPDDGSTVGTGMIVSFDFNRPITERTAVQRAIKVSAQPPVEIEPHWFGDDRLDFRPRAYWRPGTRVTLDLRLRDVKGAPGAYGTQHKKVSFTVGRDQTSLVDAEEHTMTVRRGGKVVRIVPISAGAPGNTTYNGKMVVMERHEVTRMDGSTVGFGGEYDIEDVPHAMRLTTSGTFLHGNYWSAPGVFGAGNASHGCVGLRDVKGGGRSTPAGWFYRSSMIGDVVEVVGSHDRTVAPDNGLGGWNMPWREWRETQAGAGKAR